MGINTLSGPIEDVNELIDFIDKEQVARDVEAGATYLEAVDAQVKKYELEADETVVVEAAAKIEAEAK